MIPAFQVLVGVLLIIFLSWFAGISEHTGNLAVGIVLLLWFLYLLSNGSKIQAFASKATGRG